VLTSRQLAVVVWLVVIMAFVVVLALAKKDVRESLLDTLRTLASPKLSILFAAIIGYNIAVVWALWRVGYWDTSMLYDTVAFVAIGGIGSVGRAATSRGVTYDWRFYLKTILVNFELMVVVLFLFDFYSLSFWVEFFLVIPLTALVVMLVVVSGYQNGAEQVHRFLSGVQAAIGLLLLAYVVWRVVADYQDLLHLQVAFALGLPIVMSVLFVPLLFIACVLFAYEDAFLVVSFKMDDNKRLARWKKRRLLLHFGLNLKALQGFRRSSGIQEYAWVKTEAEARECLHAGA
jgi:hypothetical protein